MRNQAPPTPNTSERRAELRIAHLYMNPPGGAIVLTFNQKSQI
jgi:hypothetical protein